MYDPRGRLGFRGCRAWCETPDLRDVDDAPVAVWINPIVPLATMLLLAARTITTSGRPIQCCIAINDVGSQRAIAVARV
jgi:hypothetical protein